MNRQENGGQDPYKFSLKPLRIDCYYKKVYQKQFQPSPNHIEYNYCPHEPTKQIIPIFLRDKKFYTPSFIVSRTQQLQLTKLLYSKFKYYQEYQKQTKFLIQDDNMCQQIFIEAPKKKLCYVCHQYYEESYFEHIVQQNHKFYIKISKANKYIYSLCKKYKKIISKNKRILAGRPLIRRKTNPYDRQYKQYNKNKMRHKINKKCKIAQKKKYLKRISQALKRKQEQQINRLFRIQIQSEPPMKYPLNFFKIDPQRVQPNSFC